MYLWGTELIYSSRDQKCELIRDLNISGINFRIEFAPAVCSLRFVDHETPRTMPPLVSLMARVSRWRC